MRYLRRTGFLLCMAAVAAALSAAQQPPNRITLGADVMMRKLTRWVAPEAPEGERGTVKFQLLITPEGNVREIAQLEGSGTLGSVAQQAVSQWRFQPTLENGRPVEVITVVDITMPSTAAAPGMVVPRPLAQKKAGPPRPRPRLRNRVDPEFPPRDSRGIVTARLQVDNEGTVTSVDNLRGPEDMQEAARQAFLRWTFEPGTPGDTLASVSWPPLPRRKNSPTPRAPAPAPTPEPADDPASGDGDVERLTSQAMDALARNDRAQATALYAQAAQKDPAVYERLGDLYLYPNYGAVDVAQAAVWYRKGVDQRHAGCARYLAMIHLDPKDQHGAKFKSVEEGWRLLQTAASLGDESAKTLLADPIRTREYYLLDRKQKEAYMLAKAQAGIADAQVHYAMMLVEPFGDKPADPAPAIPWLEKASNQEHQPAQAWLSVFLLRQGKDRIRCRMWMLLASRSPEEGKQAPFQPPLTPAEEAQARKLAQEWKPAPGVTKRDRPWLNAR